MIGILVKSNDRVYYLLMTREIIEYLGTDDTIVGERNQGLYHKSSSQDQHLARPTENQPKPPESARIPTPYQSTPSPFKT